MSVSELSSSSQNYLKAVWTLQEWTDEPVTATALASRTGVRLSSASDAVRKLADQGLLDHTRYGSIALTPQGRAYALTMVRRHRLIETFLVQVLGYRWDEVHDEAEQLEHAVSDLLVERIAAQLGHPDRDPHGDPIPTADGEVHLPTTVVLTDLPAGHRGRIERISDADPELLQFFAAKGIDVGVEFTVEAGEPFSESISLVLDGGETVPLGRAATDAVRASDLSEMA